MKPNARLALFSRLSFATIIAVYLLILVGGIVRSTGSGMGCPDWPKCFGSWIPPVDKSQLPTNYKEIYSQKRALKGKRISGILNVVGLTGLSERVVKHTSLAPETEFNKFKTWTEYINRLVGLLIGLFVMATFVASIAIRKEHRSIFVLSLLALILVAFEGWLGSLVVSTHLLPGMVTLHMTLALVIVALLIVIFHKAGRPEQIRAQITSSAWMNMLVTLCLITFIVQAILGTQVREGIDAIAASAQHSRVDWISNLGWSFLVHRSFSLLVLALNVALVYFLLKRPSVTSYLKSLGVSMLILLILEIVTGAFMAYMGVPAFLQPVHLLLASIIFGLQFLIFLQMNPHISSATTKEFSYSAI